MQNGYVELKHGSVFPHLVCLCVQPQFLGNGLQDRKRSDTRLIGLHDRERLDTRLTGLQDRERSDTRLIGLQDRERSDTRLTQ